MRKLKKVYLFGDSVMKGITYNAARGRYAVAGRHLAPPEGVEIVNCAHMGATLAEVREQIARALPQPEEGAVAVLSFGGNDSGHNWKQVDADPQAEHLCLTEPGPFTEGYGECIAQLSARAERVLATDLAPIDAQRYFPVLVRDLDLNAERIRGWLGDVERLSRWQEYYSNLAVLAALHGGAQLVDIRSPFLLSKRFEALLADDGIHPSPEGHALIDAKLQSALFG